MKNSSNLIKAAFILATSLLAAFPAISIASPETEEGFLSPPMSASPVAAPNGGKFSLYQMLLVEKQFGQQIATVRTQSH